MRYESNLRNHVRPAMGSLQLHKLDGELIDRFFAQLRRCRERCGGRTKHIKHWRQKEHECDHRCTTVPCAPLSSSSIRGIYFDLTAAFDCAVRWRWLGQNPMDFANDAPAIQMNPAPRRPLKPPR